MRFKHLKRVYNASNFALILATFSIYTIFYATMNFLGQISKQDIFNLLVQVFVMHFSFSYTNSIFLVFSCSRKAINCSKSSSPKFIRFSVHNFYIIFLLFLC